MMKRHPGGRWRNARKAVVVSEAIQGARWIAAETISLKRMELSFDAIVEQITRRSRPSPTDGRASQGRKVSSRLHNHRQACHKTFRKAIAQEPSLAVDELRKLDNARAEELFMNLQPRIRKGEVRAV
jgi:hypothetical protein